MNAGIFMAADFYRNRFERALPPGHRIRATRDDGTGLGLFTEFIIEGPMLPTVEAGKYPPRMTMILRFQPDEAGPEALRLEGYCVIDSDENPRKHYGEWVIGAWPNFRAFQEEWDHEGVCGRVPGDCF